MAEHLFSVPLDVVAPEPKGEPAARTRAVGPQVRRSARPRSKPKVTLQWEDAHGRATGKRRELQVPDPVPLEFPSVNGRMSWADIPSSLSFSDDPPDDAVALRLKTRGPATRIPRGALGARAVASLPTPKKTPFGDPGATFLVPVFSERFADEATFLARIGELHGWIMDQEPFNREPAKSRLGLIAHFWASDPESGLFATTDDKSQSERLFFGDRALAKTLLDPFIGKAAISLILINSKKRGGAGGAPGFSAWTSVTPGRARTLGSRLFA